MKIELLDYTLRAGLSNQLTAEHIYRYDNLVWELAASGIENIELGYLTENENSFYWPLPCSIEEYDPLTKNRKPSYSVMLHPSGYDCRCLPDCNGKIQYIRLLLNRNARESCYHFIRTITGKGYQVICDLTDIYAYTDLELLTVCSELNGLDVAQVTIPDNTMGMDARPVQKAALLLDKNLARETKIGLRSGGNGGMASYIANNFLDVPMQRDRTVVIEGTLMGIGLIKHNLCTECMADQLNADYGRDYDYEHLIDLISLFIPGSNANPSVFCGYHPAFYLTAKNQVDEDYARYFLSKGFMLYNLNGLLKQVAESETFQMFDESVAERIYLRNKELLK